jgi:hypothetical protein
MAALANWKIDGDPIHSLGVLGSVYVFLIFYKGLKEGK